MSNPSTRFPVRIAHVVYSFGYGGLERRILRLIDGLLPLGAEFTIVSLRPSDGTFLRVHPRVRHLVLDARPGFDLPAVWRLVRILREARIQVVHSHNWVSMLEGIVAGRLAGVPVIAHGEHGASRFEPAQLTWKRTLVQALLARAATTIIPVNESIRDRIADVWRLPPARCTVIRNGVDTEKYCPVSRPTDGRIVVGSVSRLADIKNFPSLIRAIAHLNQAQDARYTLVIVGDGPERENLAGLIAELDAGDYIRLAGASDAPETWYPRFDLYVNCSFSEGMSNTVLEAMSCGCPVIVTDVAGHRDWLVADENALFVAVDDHLALAGAIAALADDPARRTRMQAANRRRVLEDFSEARFVAHYLAHYRAMLRAAGVDVEADHAPAIR